MSSIDKWAGDKQPQRRGTVEDYESIVKVRGDIDSLGIKGVSVADVQKAMKNLTQQINRYQKAQQSVARTVNTALSQVSNRMKEDMYLDKLRNNELESLGHKANAQVRNRMMEDLIDRNSGTVVFDVRRLAKWDIESGTGRGVSCSVISLDGTRRLLEFDHHVKSVNVLKKSADDKVATYFKGVLFMYDLDEIDTTDESITFDFVDAGFHKVANRLWLDYLGAYIPQDMDGSYDMVVSTVALLTDTSNKYQRLPKLNDEYPVFGIELVKISDDYWELTIDHGKSSWRVVDFRYIDGKMIASRFEDRNTKHLIEHNGKSLRDFLTMIMFPRHTSKGETAYTLNVDDPYVFFANLMNWITGMQYPKNPSTYFGYAYYEDRFDVQ